MCKRYADDITTNEFMHPGFCLFVLENVNSSNSVSFSPGVVLNFIKNYARGIYPFDVVYLVMGVLAQVSCHSSLTAGWSVSARKCVLGFLMQGIS